jgi:acetyltransferase
MARRWRWLQRRPAKTPKYRVDKAAAARLFRAHRGREWLPGAVAEAVLQAYGVPFAASRRVHEPGDAVAAAHKVGFPVVLKAEAADLVHKSEHRAVRTGLRSGDEVFAAAQDLLARLKPQFGDVSLQVQRHAEGHREVLLGMTRDPRYGPLFAAGLGGVQVELLRDVAIRIGPLDGQDPAEMFASLKGAALLATFRGEPAADVAAAIEVLLRLQRLTDDFPRIVEVELNPFILAKKGGHSVAVDARLKVHAS